MIVVLNHMIKKPYIPMKIDNNHSNKNPCIPMIYLCGRGLTRLRTSLKAKPVQSCYTKDKIKKPYIPMSPVLVLRNNMLSQ